MSSLSFTRLFWLERDARTTYFNHPEDFYAFERDDRVMKDSDLILNERTYMEVRIDSGGKETGGQTDKPSHGDVQTQPKTTSSSACII